MIESMATGTPVIGMGLAHRNHRPWENWFCLHSLEKMIEAIPAAMQLDRQTCRDYVLSRFSVQAMTDEYEKFSRCVT